MDIFLLIISIILLVALVAINISGRSGIPSLLLFLILGIFSNLLGMKFENYQISEKFASLALVIIIFYGGFGTNWKLAKLVAKPAGILASFGVVFTALLVGAFAYYILKIPFLESMLLGSIIASTDYASVSNILVSKKLNLKYNTASLLELESGSNDPVAYTMTMIFLSLISGTKIFIPLMIFKQLVFGALFGFVIAYFVSKLIDYIDLKKDGLAIVFMFAMALFTYSLTNIAGGNAYLAVYIFGIYVGNKDFIGKRNIVYFFDGFTELMSIGLFYLLGLLSTPSRIISSLPSALIIMLFMTILARPLCVFILMKLFKFKNNQLLTISFVGLRGAAAIVFAIMAINTKIDFSIDIYHIVFGICILSSLLQGTFMPKLIKISDMIDPGDTILRTFNYYVDKGAINFIQFKITKRSSFIGKALRDINVDNSFIICKIIRKGRVIVPKGDVVIELGDVIVISGQEYFDSSSQDLLEFSITQNHKWKDRYIKELELQQNELIVSINRDVEIILVAGDTKIELGDRVILFKGENRCYKG